MAPIGIAVIGLGRAGKARVRDVTARPRFALSGIVSRRAEARTRSFEDVLADPDVHAVAVCTENAHHEGCVRSALAASKHVLVEYPLALSFAAARELFGRADAAGRVLHEEHIELLSDAYRALRDEVGRAGALRSGEVHFTGPCGGWVGDEGVGGFPSFSGIARLHRLLDLFGPLALEDAALERPPGGGFTLRVGLRTEGGAELRWIEERGPALARAQTARLVFEDGAELTRWPRGPAGPVFAADLELFGDEIEGKRDMLAERGRILAALALAEEIAAASLHP